MGRFPKVRRNDLMALPVVTTTDLFQGVAQADLEGILLTLRLTHEELAKTQPG